QRPLASILFVLLVGYHRPGDTHQSRCNPRSSNGRARRFRVVPPFGEDRRREMESSVVYDRLRISKNFTTTLGAFSKHSLASKCSTTLMPYALKSRSRS